MRLVNKLTVHQEKRPLHFIYSHDWEVQVCFKEKIQWSVWYVLFCVLFSLFFLLCIFDIKRQHVG